MAKTFLSSLTLLLLLSSAAATATKGRSSASAGYWQQGECNINRINAQEPSFRLQSEGGVSEFWDHNSDEFRCAGVSIHRHTIKSRGMLLPVYHNAPMLVYVLQGRGMYGVTIAGCPETFESAQQSPEGRMRSERYSDRHQRVGVLKEGDVVAIRAGDAHWAYNNGEQDLVVVVLQDNTNYANQLDQNPRSFFLAGSPDWGQQQQKEQRRFRGEEKREQQHEFGNIFKGMSVQSLSEAFDVDEATARKLQSENDERGMIVIVENELRVIKPPLREEEEEEHGGAYAANGFEETFCTAKDKVNVDNPSRAAVYNPQAGRLSIVNSFTLPLLRFLQLSFVKGLLHKNAIMAPHWVVNAHSILYITSGEKRIQIVNHNGQAVFDGQVQAGQVLVVPQNFAVIKQGGEQGCEWIEFQTNDNAMMNTLSGRTSALRGLPLDVVATAYQVSTEEARRLKFSREESLFFRSSTAYYGRRSVASA